MEGLNNIKIIEDNLEIRINPHIYAFSTNTKPNYLKIGDTFRPVNVRINEWQRKLQSTNSLTKVSKQGEWTSLINVHKSIELFFRDYSVHKFLTENLKKKNITDEELVKLYSREFFENTNVEDVLEAIKDIRNDCLSESAEKRYDFYKIEDGRNQEFHGKNDKEWSLRPNQETVVKNFKEKYEKNTKLLMYAVMRFGKSFTAMQCALAANATKVLIVSAKADVASEWKRTIETPTCFKEYSFLTDRNFVEDKDIINKKINDSEKGKVAVFMTLQNLAGKSNNAENIKKKLEKLFKAEFDLIIIDETHYGAWASSYGRPIQEEDEAYISEEINEKENLLEEQSKINGKLRLHLSGTPYNLLYDEKFDESNIIASYQFSDILKEKEEWSKEHFEDIENGEINPETGYAYEEYDNPYFGFPKMLRFAFNLPKKSRKSLQSLSNWSLSDLFKTEQKDEQTIFIYEDAVLDLLKIIDGSENDENVLSFLDIPKIKDNDICKHMVFVLPYKASCDAMENLLKKHDFKNLPENVLNITGYTVTTELNTVEKVKNRISELEQEGQKTITLTVQKMLTGVTVKEWDTMIMLKNTKSAQEYDQAIFRIQNQYVNEYVDSNNRIMKKDMKPQTILVDFDPIRMFELQGLSARIVNNVVGSGNIQLNDAIKNELKFFPIITFNGKNLVKVKPQNIVEILCNYNKNKSISDDAMNINLDKSLLKHQDILDFINTQSKLSLTNSIMIDAHDGDESDIAIPESLDELKNRIKEKKESQVVTDSQDLTNKEERELIQKFRMCMVSIMFYSFLSQSSLDTLEDVLKSLYDENVKNNNKRVFKNLKLSANFIASVIAKSSRIGIFDINDKIKHANLLSKDSSLNLEDRAKNALARFSKISASEIVTPSKICSDMLDTIGVEKLVEIVNKDGRILDIASKTGEFSFALYSLLKAKVDNEKLKKSIYVIPTSTVTYEFTRKMFEILGLPLENIANEFNSYDLLNVKILNKNGKVTDAIDYEKVAKILKQKKKFSEIRLDDDIKEGDEQVNFEAIVGNPPYQIMDDGHGVSAKPVYDKFVDLVKNIDPQFTTMIMPSRWFAGGKGLDDFRKRMLKDKKIKCLVDYENSPEIFPDVDIAGGVCYFLWDKSYNGRCNVINFVKGQQFVNKRNLDDYSILVRNSYSLQIINKIKCLNENNGVTLDAKISVRKPFGLATNYEPKKNGIPCWFKQKIGLSFASQEDIQDSSNLLNKWKLLIPPAPIAGQTDFSKPISFYYDKNTKIAKPGECCTESWLVACAFDNEKEVINFKSYLFTKTIRFLLLQSVVSQHVTKQNFIFVPDIGVYNKLFKDDDLKNRWGITEDEWRYIDSRIK